MANYMNGVPTCGTVTQREKSGILMGAPTYNMMRGSPVALNRSFAYYVEEAGLMSQFFAALLTDIVIIQHLSAHTVA